MRATAGARGGRRAGGRRRAALALLLALTVLAAAGRGGATRAVAATGDTLAVDVTQPLRAVAPRVLGVNTNYLTDDANARARGQGYTAALAEAGVGSMRYPGGEDSDAYLWSTAPFEAPRPTLARTGPHEWPSGDRTLVAADGTTFLAPPLDFDQFVATAHAVGADPTIVVAFDSMYKPATAGGTAPSRQLLLDTAVAWVRYANVTRGYNIRNWELGNESYFDVYDGGARADDYARDAVDFARAMKAVDPTIRIGVNGPDDANAVGDRDRAAGVTTPWWQTVLTVAAPNVDFLAVHAYVAWQWGGYETYRSGTPSLTTAVDAGATARTRWGGADAARLGIAVTEANAGDWSTGGWANVNDTGHALVVAEQLGTYLADPRVEAAQIWNTRWVHAASTELWNTLGVDNQLNPTGRVLALWASAKGDTGARLVATTSTSAVRLFAIDQPGGALRLLVVNKDTVAHPIDVALPGTGARSGSWTSLVGTGPADVAPAVQALGTVSTAGEHLTVTLPATSFSVFTLAGGTAATPTPTATATVLPTATLVPTATATVLPTATLVPTATATVLPTATATVVPTATATVVPTATATLVPPSATATPRPVTPTPTPTPKHRPKLRTGIAARTIGPPPA